MTDLIVRPIDDDRYSERSQADYIILMLEYDAPNCKLELLKFQCRVTVKNIKKAAHKMANWLDKNFNLKDSNEVVHSKESVKVIKNPRVAVSKDGKSYKPLSVNDIAIYIDEHNVV